jgi:lysosomal Pro-X carboxypeptidase
MKGLIIFALCAVGCLSILKTKNLSGAVPPGFTLMYFNATIDHYAPSSGKFGLRYYINSDSWRNTPSSPIFFYCGNEGPIELFVNNTGYMTSLAGTLGALVVFAEHRYFGGSMPFGNLSYATPGNLKYLSPHQALADFAELIQQLKFEYSQAPVVVWGGSYGGMLAAWMRMKFPHLVHGAIASSAPILAFNDTVDPYRFNEIVTYQFSVIGGAECPTIIRTAFQMLNDMMYNSSAYFELQNIFNTCEDIITPDDIQSIMYWLSNAFTYMAMTDYSNSSSFLQPMPAYPVAVACDSIVTQVRNGGNDLTDPYLVFPAVISGANVYYNYTQNTSCNELNLEINSNLGDEGWDYLACTTMNMPIGSTGVRDMFWDDPWDQSAVDSQCLQTWGVTTQVNYANLWYGTSRNQTYILRHASNILFSSGEYDPWRSGSVTESSNPNILAYTMLGAVHHSDLRAPLSGDLPDVVNGRILIFQAIKYWIYGEAV